MDKKLHILMIEDNPADARLIEEQLGGGGLDYEVRYAESTQQFIDEIALHPPDVILSDHGLRSYDSFKALSVARQCSPPVPFIFVTGSLGEEQTIQAFEDGAADCVLKHRMSSLVPVIRRVVLEAAEWRKRRELETEREQVIQDLQAELAKARTLSGVVAICSCCKNIRDERGHWRSYEQYIESHSSVRFSHGVCPECAWRVYRTEVEGKD